MSVVFPLIFVADTKLIYGYNFVASLKLSYKSDYSINLKRLKSVNQKYIVPHNHDVRITLTGIKFISKMSQISDINIYFFY